VTFGGGNIPAAGTADRYPNPWYETPDAGTTELFIGPLPFAATISNMRVIWTPASGAVNITVLLRVNSVDTALSATALATAGAASDLVDSVAVVAGDKISVVVRKSAGTTSAMGLFFVNLQMTA
jgi:hypothetical protein